MYEGRDYSKVSDADKRTFDQLFAGNSPCIYIYLKIRQLHLHTCTLSCPIVYVRIIYISVHMYMYIIIMCIIHLWCDFWTRLKLVLETELYPGLGGGHETRVMRICTYVHMTGEFNVLHV